MADALRVAKRGSASAWGVFYGCLAVGATLTHGSGL